MRYAPVLLLVLATVAPNAQAHEVRPAYLELRQTDPETWEALWKVPGLGDSLRLALYVELPPDCKRLGTSRISIADDAHAERWTFRRPGGLAGADIRIAGLSATQTDVLVRLERLDGTTQVERLTPSDTSFTVAAAPDAWDVTRTYALLGVEHILLGFDHLLFVLGLLILTQGGWRLVKTVTAFTVSHGVTLTLATLGYVHVPQRPVEAVIALSIVFVAAEIVHGRAGRPGITARAPWIVALTFGLMHGLGFAGALSEVGLPQAHIPTALLFFSLGVEVGHLLFIGAVLSVVALGRRLRWPVPGWLGLVPAYAIGAVAMFWVFQRTLP
jgi:hypothetical protein